MLEEILNIIFPNVCGMCGKIDKEGLCESCKTKLSAKIVCDEYKYKNFEKHIYLFSYQGKIRDKILNYKFRDKSYLYKTFAKIILNNKKVCQILKTYDIITFVPTHKKRKSSRGYDQSELIAKCIAKNIKEITYEKTLQKQKNTKKQSLLTKRERIQNVKDAYEIIEKEKIYRKRIILFDDIYTTRCNNK